MSAHWFAADATAAAWAQAFVLQPIAEDVDATFTDGDWQTCVDCALDTVVAVCFVLATLDGYAGPPPSQPETIVRAARDGGPAAELLLQLPEAWGASQADAERAVAIVRDACALVEDAVPLSVADFRTPEGFYPGVRAAKDLEKLRSRMGLPGYAWKHWAT